MKRMMARNVIILPPEEVDLLEDVADRAAGSRINMYQKRFLKGIMLQGTMISYRDRSIPRLVEFQKIIDKICAAGSKYTNVQGSVYTVELSDQRLPQKGIWHTDASDPDSWLNLMVPLDDITPANGGTVLHNSGDSSSHTHLYGARGHVYAFKGCTRHCVEGNRERLPRRLLIIVTRPRRYLDTPNVNVETYRRVLTSQSKENRPKWKAVGAVSTVQTRSRTSGRTGTILTSQVGKRKRTKTRNPSHVGAALQ